MQHFFYFTEKNLITINPINNQTILPIQSQYPSP